MINRLLKAHLVASKRSVLLLGPRQTGKSTLTHALGPHLEINLMRESTFLEYSANPGALESSLAAMPQAKLIMIDEIQRLPSLMNTLQAEIDATKQRRKFLLTGSSARKLRSGQANLLPGRLAIFYLGPLVAAELDYQLATQRALSLGTLPEPYLLKGNEESQKLLMDYASTYLKEEIRLEALTRNLSGFTRFLYAAAAASGQFLDFSKLARRAKVPRQSALRYFEILEDTLVAQRIECIDPALAPKADLVRHPRYFFFDVGVLNGILQNFVVSNDRIGLLFEHLLVTQITASAQARALPYKLWNFRTRGGLEVDLVLQLNRKMHLIEIKACKTTDISTHDITPLQECQRYLSQKSAAVVLCLDGTERQVGGVPILAWQRGLQRIGL
jgi:predicted AAA+ superfamily ATPase